MRALAYEMVRGLLLVLLGIAAASSIVHAQVKPVYSQDPVTGNATQQQLISVPSGQSITIQSGATLTCLPGSSCTGGTVPLTPGTTTITGGTASGILWNNAGVLAAGPATMDASGDLVSTSMRTSTIGLSWGAAGLGITTSTGLWGWSANTNIQGSADTGLSRTSAGTIAVGNGTAGDTSGTVQAGTGTFVSTSTGQSFTATSGTGSIQVRNNTVVLSVPTSAGTVKGTLCIDVGGTVYVKTTTGACL